MWPVWLVALILRNCIENSLYRLKMWISRTWGVLCCRGTCRYLAVQSMQCQWINVLMRIFQEWIHTIPTLWLIRFGEGHLTWICSTLRNSKDVCSSANSIQMYVVHRGHYFTISTFKEIAFSISSYCIPATKVGTREIAWHSVPNMYNNIPHSSPFFQSTRREIGS